MNEQTPDQADTRTLALDQLRLIGDLLSCFDAVGYDPRDTQQLRLLLAARLRSQAGPLPGPEGDGHASRQGSDEELLDSLDVAILIARSSLGAPSTRRIQYQTSAAQIAEILRRRDQAAATGQPLACPAETTITKSAITAALLPEDKRPDAATRPRQCERWRFRMSSARDLLVILAEAQRKVLGAFAGVLISLLSCLIASMPGKVRMLPRAFLPIRPTIVVGAAIAAVAMLVFIAARQQPGPSMDPAVIAGWPASPQQPAPSPLPTSVHPRITATYTYQQGESVVFEIYYSDPGHDAAGFSFVGVDESDLPRQVIPFSSLGPGVVETGLISYPLNQGCGTGVEYTNTIKAWIYDNTGARSKPVIIHLSCVT